MSFGFRVAEDGEIDRAGKLRAIKTIQNLYDVFGHSLAIRRGCRPAQPVSASGSVDKSVDNPVDNSVDKIVDNSTFVSRSQDRKEIIERAQSYLSQRRINYVVRY
jgi:hypothetical protein